ncbi:hypothetical protein GALL_460890 [mine drainage metagenome]|uniref:Uncharacterized protein n=1 Tax=mine drainage metagenome TaxID=410659 RepID=A0A1J5Q8J5_9ZZZZ
MAVGKLGDGRNVGHPALRVADRFDVHRLGFVIDQGFKAGQVAWVGKAHVDA